MRWENFRKISGWEIDFYLLTEINKCWHPNCLNKKRLKIIPERNVMNKRSILERKILLNLASHHLVSWTFVKLSSVYKYVRLFV